MPVVANQYLNQTDPGRIDILGGSGSSFPGHLGLATASAKAIHDHPQYYIDDAMDLLGNISNAQSRYNDHRYGGLPIGYSMDDFNSVAGDVGELIFGLDPGGHLDRYNRNQIETTVDGSGDGTYTGSNGVGNSYGSAKAALDYLEAPYASAYGMDNDIAYQEALSNTAYRRAVHDMQEAGLNPATLFSSGTSASSVSASSDTAASGTAEETDSLLEIIGALLGAKFIGGKYGAQTGAAVGKYINGLFED